MLLALRHRLGCSCKIPYFRGAKTRSNYHKAWGNGVAGDPHILVAPKTDSRDRGIFTNAPPLVLEDHPAIVNPMLTGNM